ncbi:MAG: hypothetical protein C0418_02155 [Coriobacteriaceae bacterium]|nr:hypothetical protein [Coriobacteriaceae bacterium]
MSTCPDARLGPRRSSTASCSSKRRSARPRRSALPPDATALSRTLVSAGVEGAGVSEEALGVLARVPTDAVAGALAALAEDGYSFLVDLFVTDSGEALELTYHLRSFGTDDEVFVRAVAGHGAEVPSVWETHPAALYAEREAAEMFGLSFPGHPNPKRLLTTDEIGEPPLLKSVPLRAHHEVARPGIVRVAPEPSQEDEG